MTKKRIGGTLIAFASLLFISAFVMMVVAFHGVALNEAQPSAVARDFKFALIPFSVGFPLLGGGLVLIVVGWFQERNLARVTD